MATLENMIEHCENCGVELEIGQIEKCDDCQVVDSDKLRTFEVTACGFEASTSDTHERVFWIRAESAAVVVAAIEGCAAGFHDQIDIDDDFDFELPAQTQEFRAALMRYVS